MNNLVKNFGKSEKYTFLLEKLKEEKEEISVFGLESTISAHMVYSLSLNSDKSACIVCPNAMQARKTIADLKFVSDIEIVYFPARQLTYYNVEAESKEVQNARMYAIERIISKKKIILVTTIDAIRQKVLKFAKIKK